MRRKELWGLWAKFVIGTSVSLAVILGVTYKLSPTDFANNFANALVAWGTLMLATATFMLIRRSEKSEKRREKENESLRKEDRERELKRHSLELISDWAQRAFDNIGNFPEIISKSDLWKIAILNSNLHLTATSLHPFVPVFKGDFCSKLENSISAFIAYNDMIRNTLLNKDISELIPKDHLDKIEQVHMYTFEQIRELILSISEVKIQNKL